MNSTPPPVEQHTPRMTQLLNRRVRFGKTAPLLRLHFELQTDIFCYSDQSREPSPSPAPGGNEQVVGSAGRYYNASPSYEMQQTVVR